MGDGSPTRPGDVQWVGFSIFILSNFAPELDPDIVFQWKQLDDPPVCDVGLKKPPLTLQTKCRTADWSGGSDTTTGTCAAGGGRWRLRYNYDDQECSSPASLEGKQTASNDFGPLTPGWHDFVFKITWRYTSSGRVEVWHQAPGASGFTKTIDRSGPIGYRDALKGYIKWGVYKPHWSEVGPTTVPQRVYFHDTIKVGDSWEEVDPTVDILFPVSDSYVRAGTYANTNYGSDSRLVVKEAGSDWDYMRRSYLKFDLNALTGVDITSAKLHLKVASYSSTNDAQSVTVTADNWNQGSITNLAKPNEMYFVRSFTATSAGTWFDR